MKRLVKTVQKNVTVDVCDVCGKEQIVIDWDAYYICSSDGCYDDKNEYHFCSFAHLLDFVKEEFSKPDWITHKEPVTAMGIDEHSLNTLHLTLRGEGISDVTDFLFALKKASLEQQGGDHA